MRALFCTLFIGLAAAVLTAPRALSQDNEWTDLFGRDLKDWSRSGTGASPWRMTTDRTLTCERGTEVYIPEREFFDGTLKFEYRFRPNGEKNGYKAAVWARRTLHETGFRVALGDDCGTMTAVFQGGSDRTKMLEEKPAENAAKLIGEWNQVRISLEGRSATVYINDKQVASFSQCDSIRGLIALEADGSEVEFRNVWWKDGK